VSPSEKIVELRRRGYTVRVQHLRRASDGGLYAKWELDELKKMFPYGGEAGLYAKRVSLLPTGGKTVVRLEGPGGNYGSTGVADCSEKDNFNKKLGLRIALARAVDHLGVEL